MRADRLIAILLLLHGRPRTVRDLAERLEVTPRTVQRDMDALSAAGVPVVATRGNGGGWSLLAGYRANLTALTDPEVQAIAIAARLPAGLGLREAGEGAVLKLLAALPESRRRAAEDLRQRMHIDPSGWNDDTGTTLPILQDALRRNRRVVLAYATRQRGTTDRLVDPLGLVVKGGVWYLIAASGGEPRTYRVSRILGVAPTDDEAHRPAGFDLAAYWSEASAAFAANLPRFAVTVRASPIAFSRIHFAGRFIIVGETGPPDNSGWRTVTLHLSVEEEIAGYLLSFGGEIQVIDPPDLRDRILATALSIADAYDPSATIARSASS